MGGGCSDEVPSDPGAKGWLRGPVSGGGVLVAQNGVFVTKLEGLEWSLRQELPSVTALPGSNPWLFLPQGGAGYGLRSRSLLDPDVYSASLMAQDGRVEFPDGGGRTHGNQRVQDPILTPRLVQDRYPPFEFKYFLAQTDTAVTSGGR